MCLDEAIHIEGTGFGMVCLEMADDLYPLDLVSGGCKVVVRLEQGAVGGPLLAEIPADQEFGSMGIWSFNMTPHEVQSVWPDDVVFVVAEYLTASSPNSRTAKAIIHKSKV